MDRYQFRRWVEKAVSGIAFPPDRQKVYQELMDHMEDHCEMLLEAGIDEDTARQMAVDAMGDACEIAPQLAAIHRPFWGYFLRATRVILVIALVITLIPLARYAWITEYDGVAHWASWDVLDEGSYGPGTGRTLYHLSQPNVSQSSDGYTFTLTDAVHWYNEEYDNSCFYILMEEFHPLPWAEHDQVRVWLWAEDSLGNTYECQYEHRPDEETPVVFTWGDATSPFTCTYTLWINDAVPPEARWLDIRYTREGRDLVWRIGLTGGDAA